MIVIKNVYGGSQVYIKSIYSDVETIIVYNGGDPITVTGSGGGSGDVVGPASATDNAIVRFNLTTGKLIQNSGATIDDSGNISATNLSGTNTGDQDLSGYAPALGVDDNYVTDAEKTKLANLSGTNTGDQDLSGKQDVLVSGTNIKTINSTSLLGSGDILIQSGVPYSIEILLHRALGSNILAQSFDLFLGQSSSRAGSDGRLDLTAIYLNAGTITGTWWLQQTKGVYTGDNYNGIGLYAISGTNLTLVASTTNDANCWATPAANSMNSKAFSIPYNAAAGVYYIGWLYNQSAQTTAPTIQAKPNTVNFSFSNNTPFYTINMFLGYSVASQSTLPASLTLSALTTSAIGVWHGLY